MHSFWQTKTGKLFMGGCGSQIGLLFALGGLLVSLLFCSICISVNVVSAGVNRLLAGPAATTSPAAPAPADLAATLTEINRLLSELESLQAGGAIAPILIQTEAAPATKPMAVVNPAGVTLFSGPGATYDQLGSLPAGAQLELVGRNVDSSWWLVAMPNGVFAWAAAAAVTAPGGSEAVPVVAMPGQLVQPASSGSLGGVTAAVSPTATIRPTPVLPPGTPTPTIDQERQFVEELPAYQRVKAALLTPPVSASLSPDGSRMAMTEGIKLYTVTTAGAHTDLWLEENAELKPVGGAVWSPDGQLLAVVVDFKNRPCPPCRAVAVISLADDTITFLETAEGLDTDAPRWTQDGRILVNAHPGEPADGITYVFDRYGLGQPATGDYVLSSSHEGQKWYPWLPGRTWRAGVSERADSYYQD